MIDRGTFYVIVVGRRYVKSELPVILTQNLQSAFRWTVQDRAKRVAYKLRDSGVTNANGKREVVLVQQVAIEDYVLLQPLPTSKRV